MKAAAGASLIGENCSLEVRAAANKLGGGGEEGGAGCGRGGGAGLFFNENMGLPKAFPLQRLPHRWTL